MDNLSDDIINYKKGKLSPSQMHALEKRALDDPFLAEALEGIGNLSDEELADDISAINEKIGRKKNTILFTPLRIAAGVALLIGSVFFIYQLIPQPERIALKVEKIEREKQKAESEKPKIESQKPKAESGEQKEERHEPKAESEKQKGESGKQKAESEKEKVENGKQLAKAESPAAGVSQPTPAPALDLASAESLHQVKADGDVANAKAEEKVNELADNSQAASGAQPATADRNKKSFFKNDARRSAPSSLKTSRSVSGQVLSADDGTPLPGASVAVNGTSTSATTDLNGNYSIPIEADKSSLTISYPGLQPVKEDASAIDQVDVQMKADTSQLSVIVVTRAGVTTQNNASAIQLAEPAVGKMAYDEYLKTNLQYPQDALSKNIKGYAGITFILNEDGSLVDFRIITKLGHGCEDEIIRLVKEGPKWKPTAENGITIKSTIKLRVQFNPARLRK